MSSGELRVLDLGPAAELPYGRLVVEVTASSSAPVECGIYLRSPELQPSFARIGEVRGTEGYGRFETEVRPVAGEPYRYVTVVVGVGTLDPYEPEPRFSVRVLANGTEVAEAADLDMRTVLQFLLVFREGLEEPRKVARPESVVGASLSAAALIAAGLLLSR